MDLKKIDFKTWVIIVLGVALIISFFFGQRNNIDTHKDEIKALHENNAKLLHSNDSLKKANVAADAAIADITKMLEVNSGKLADTQTELDKLKKRKNETFNHVNNLSANGVSDAFSDFLDERTKSTNAR